MIDWNDYFIYEECSGRLIWRVSPNNNVKSGSEAGYINGVSGYRMLKFNGATKMVHRIVWEILHPGEILNSTDEIDHIDHDKLNNRSSNLRKVDCAVNQRNRPMHRDNTSGVTGVCWYSKYSCWRVQIRGDGRPKHIGYFEDFDAAVKARKAAEVKYGFHENHGQKRGG